MKHINFIRKGSIFLTILTALMLSGLKNTSAQSCNAMFGYIANPSGVVTFYDSSSASGSITSNLWIFGDGTSGTGSVVTHQYNGVGPYTVCLYISTANGCSDSTCNVVYLNPCNLTATITYDSLAGTLSANASGGVAPFTYLWNNGSTSSVINNVALNTTYCCTVTDANGCTDSDCFYTSAGATCNANFSYITNPNGGVTFYDSSSASGFITSYLWIFGDGTSGTGSMVTHQYNGVGPYTVCLYISTANGCNDSTCNVVYLNPCNLTATITYDSLASTLSANASGGVAPFTYLWSNGSTSSVINNVALNTIYCCTVTDANGCIDSVCFNTSAGATCTAFFNYNVTGSGVQFGNASTGLYSSVLWDFGDGTTSTSYNPYHIYPQNGSYNVCLTLYDLGSVCSQYCDTISITMSNSSFLCGNIFNDLNANGFNNNEPPYTSGYIILWGNGNSQTALPDSNGNYSFNVMPGSYTINYCAQQPYTLTVPVDSFGCGQYFITIGANDTICGFEFGVTLTTAIIEGYVFADYNGNGIMDANENGIPNQQVQIGNTAVTTDYSGQYSLFVPLGNFNVSYTPGGNYAGFPLTTPSSYTVNVTNLGTTYNAGNFGLNIPPGSTDISANILPSTTITPGFPAWYNLQICNNGFALTGATVTMIYDPGLLYSYSSPSAASHNASTHTLTWNIASLNPGNCLYIYVNFNSSSSYQIGDTTLEYCSAFPTNGTDINLSNNVDTIHQIVTGSWDPNNKLSIKTNNINPNQQIISSINADQKIKYTINFQNLGTAPAVNVVVKDHLSPDVDANSFQFVGSSAPANVTRIGNEVMYRFTNIMLPDATTDEPGSHGFVSYSVNAVNGLAAGTQISDFADIYFDYNSPVTTNNAVITMVGPTGLNEIDNTAQLSTYPNPLNGLSTVQFILSNKAKVSLTLMDATGRTIIQHPEAMMQAGLQKTTIDASTLADGIYLLQLTVDGKNSFMKVAVSH